MKVKNERKNLKEKTIRKNICLIMLVILALIISMTARSTYSYFTYEQMYTSSNGGVSVEYAPIHNLTIIIDSKLNTVSPQSSSGFTEVAGFSNLISNNNGAKYQRVSSSDYVSELSYSSSKVYIYKGTYEEPSNNDKKCSIKFEITSSKTTGGISNIHIPTWSDVSESEYVYKYYYNDNNNFVNPEDGASIPQKPNPCVIVKEDMDGNVTIIIRIISAYH